MTETGPVAGPIVELKPHARASVNVADTLTSDWSVSTRVTSDKALVCERTTYWNSQGGSRETAHSSIGATATAKTWYIAEGSTGRDDAGSFETWIMVTNPGPGAARVRLSYCTPGAVKVGPSFVLEAGARRSVRVADTVPDEWSVSTSVESTDGGIVAEYATFWYNSADRRQCAHGSIGVPGD